jgi:hypothetical protein
MSYHVIIQTERRSAPRELAIEFESQLHTTGESIGNLADDQIVYASRWDGRSPIIEVLKGSVDDLKMAYSGWPMITVLPVAEPMAESAIEPAVELVTEPIIDAPLDAE